MQQNLAYPNIDKCSPSSCISGRVMKCNRIIANIFRKYLKAYNITDSQLSILFVITKGKEVNQKKLSDMLFLDKSTVNRNLKRLIENNYISKKNYPLLTMTDNGLTILEDLIPSWEKAMRETYKILGQEGEEALNLLASKLIR